MEAWVEITRPDGTTERHRIEGEQVTVGRSPTAGIPLVNASDLEAEHLLVAPRPEGCWISVAEGASPATARGEIVRAQVVPWGTELRLGSVQLRVTDKPTPTRSAGGQVSWPVLIAAFVGIPLAGWMLLSEPEGELPTEAGAPPPALFDPVGECSESGPGALHVAREAAEGGSHKSERYPFAAQDGVQAVELYAIAQACYQAAGRSSDARRIRRERETLVQHIEEDYRTHRLRLERALRFQRWEDALREARALGALTVHRQGDPYVTWLMLLERRLQLIIDQRLGGGAS